MARKKVEENVEDEDIDEEEGDEGLGDEDVDSDEETEADETPDDEVEEDEPDDEGYQMEESSAGDTETVSDDRMSGLASDIPVQVVAVLGKRSFSMQDLMNFHVGQVVDLYRPANETVDLVVGGKLIAKGELVSIDGKLGVKIIKLI
jgi:flagellar motor switch protein FliN/FliY